MNTLTNPQRRVELFRRALVVGLGAQLVSAPSLLAQDASTNAPSEMKKTLVTGSFIPTADTVTAQPVDTVTAQSIQRVGTQDVLMTLKSLTPGFSGNGNVGQTVNNGGYGEAYVALRNLPTLVLLDGQRLADSALSLGAAVDLNLIPLSMVDHLDILKDGGSATYGSDAIGGVINIITKQGFNGAEAGMRYGFATEKGKYSEAKAWANLGYTDEKNMFTAGISYYYSDPLYTKDRPTGSLSASDLQAAGLSAPGYYSPTYPGRVDSVLLAGSPLAKGSPGYNPAITTPPVFAGQTFSSVSAYNNYAKTHGYPTGVYVPISGTTLSQQLAGSANIFNTTDLNTVSIQRQDRRSFLSNFEHKFYEESLTFYGQFLYSRNDNLGQLAPAPLPSLGGANLLVPANNPYNPFGIDLGAGGATSPRIRGRLIETGNRQFEATSEYFHVVTGFKGDVFENYHYDANFDYNRATQAQSLLSADASKLNLALKPLAGSTTLSQLSDSAGPVPIYNYFGLPGSNDKRTLNAILARGQQGGSAEVYTINGSIGGDVFDIPWTQKPFQLALGGQYLDESIAVSFDALSTSGNLLGFNAQNNFAGGSRHRGSAFAEAIIPVVAKENNVPGIYSFEITSGGRLERVESANLLNAQADDIVHNSLVPRVGFRWQPYDEEFTIRGTYSQSFVVPTLYTLYGPTLQNVPQIGIFDPTLGKVVTQQETVNQLSNPYLPPSTSDNKTLGFVFSPNAVKDLTLRVDFYTVQQDNIAYLANAGAIVADLNKNGAKSSWLSNPLLFGNPLYLDTGNNVYIPGASDGKGGVNGPITHANFGTLTVPTLPGASQRTEGIDFTVDYVLKTDTAGRFDFFANANLLLYYQFRADQYSQWVSYGGQYTDANSLSVPAQGALPNFKINTGVTWSYRDFDYTVIAHYTPGLRDLGDTMPLVGNTQNSFTQNGGVWQVPSYYTLDMQLAYSPRSDSGKKWYDGTRIAIGANNITDVAPPLISSSFEDNTDKSTYDILGRFVYVEFTKKF